MMGPREKLMLYGTERMSEQELLALVLGRGVRNHGVHRLAAALLERTGSLHALARCRERELMRMKGLGPAQAARLTAVFSLAKRLNSLPFHPGFKLRSSHDVFAHYHPLMRDAKREVFMVLLLDSKHRIMREERISEGSLTSSIVHPREVFQAAIRESAAAILALHNHPSGDPSPSQEDYEVTARLKEVGELVGIPLLDHIIVGDGRFISFREHRLLDWNED